MKRIIVLRCSAVFVTALCMALCIGATLHAGGSMELTRNVPHYFTGDGNNWWFVENTRMGLTEHPRAKVSIWYEGQQLKSDWEIKGGGPFGGVTTASVKTRGSLKLVVDLWDAWGVYGGQFTKNFSLDQGDNMITINHKTINFDMNFKYPSNWTTAGVVHVIVSDR